MEASSDRYDPVFGSLTPLQTNPRRRAHDLRADGEAAPTAVFQRRPQCTGSCIQTAVMQNLGGLLGVNIPPPHTSETANGHNSPASRSLCPSPAPGRRTSVIHGLIRFFKYSRSSCGRRAGGGEGGRGEITQEVPTRLGKSSARWGVRYGPLWSTNSRSSAPPPPRPPLNVFVNTVDSPGRIYFLNSFRMWSDRGREQGCVGS